MTAPRRGPTAPQRGASVQPRLRADGTTAYRLTYRLDGRQKVITFDDPAAAEAWRVRFARDAGAAHAALTAAIEAPPGVPTVDELVAQHLASLGLVQGRTVADYKRDARNHITPELGPLPATVLTSEVLAGWLRTLVDKELAAKTIANVHGLLSAACTTAVERGQLQANPCRGVHLPRAIPQEMVCLTHEQFAVLHAAVPERWRDVVLTLVASGVRWGELAALDCGRVHVAPNDSWLRIRQALGRDENNRAIVKTTKTRRSERTVRIPDTLGDVLQPLIEGRDLTDWVFLNRAGGMLRHSNFYNRVWLPATGKVEKEIGCRPRIHDLRHTYAAWNLAAGVPIYELSRQMGHESITTTVDRYGHMLPNTGAASAAAVGAALSRTLSGR